MIAGSSDEANLLAAARAGDGRALERLLALEQPRIWRFGIKMCGSADDASDVLQNTLLAAARTIRGFKGQSSVSTWLYTIARSFCIKKRRRSRFAPERELSFDSARRVERERVADEGRTPEEMMQARELSLALERALARLEPKYREVLVLRDVEGLSAPEVAKVLGLTVDAVKSRLHRARVTLREALLPQLGVGEEPPTPACPDVIRLFSKYLEDDIDPALCARMQAHVDACPRCKGACDSLKTVLSVCQASPTPKVPQGVQASVRRALAAFLAAEAAG